MTAQEYAFHSTWRVPAPPDAVFATLAALDDYPAWWPQVRRAQPLDEDACALTIRSVLPIALRILARHRRRDPAAGILEAALSGDLVGYSRWTVLARDGGTAAVFEERVELHHAVARLGLLRPALQLNHALMMRAGEAGLRARLRG